MFHHFVKSAFATVFRLRKQETPMAMIMHKDRGEGWSGQVLQYHALVRRRVIDRQALGKQEISNLDFALYGLWHKRTCDGMSTIVMA